MQDNTVTHVPGFKAGAIKAGIKKDKLDSAIIYCPTGATWAGVFTRNQVKAAPVLYNQALLDSQETVKVIYSSSGNANAVTGQQGFEDTLAIANEIASVFNCKADDVLVNATGVIGVPLPMDVIIPSIEQLPESLSEDGGKLVSKAILTTDTKTKTVAHTFGVSDVEVHIGAIAKGSGMIHPNMGTMLAYITTDVAIEKALLQKALSDAVEVTFNRITVDGDTSTNDTVLVLANGLAGNPLIADTNSVEYHTFYEELLLVCENLAKQIAADGEGATKFVTVKVDRAASEPEAKEIAMAVATSNLVKTAMHGNDANWGRIIAAIGYSGVPGVDEGSISIAFESRVGLLLVLDTGVALDFDNDAAVELLDEDDIVIHIDMGQADGNCEVWTCDFSQDYVKINADYRS
ncbi:bifunctional glutamate N-acetyltransferase/amino-acid acetyltransferase ArgJ [Aerococcaceae bacterium DSM 111022]|nr:bifunctional glutamate N-acetyltransferase/amino-acid acetyltransferase ArgJ [Aerococcaceae bacterium DSM 111022]